MYAEKNEKRKLYFSRENKYTKEKRREEKEDKKTVKHKRTINGGREIFSTQKKA